MDNAGHHPAHVGRSLQRAVVIRMATGGGKGRLRNTPTLSTAGTRTSPASRCSRPPRWRTPACSESALADPDPVIIRELAALQHEGRVARERGPVEIDKARVRRAGNDVTIIAYGMALVKSMERSPNWPRICIDCEVIDLRTLRPLTTPPSQRRRWPRPTAFIVDEDWCSGSIAGGDQRPHRSRP
ncbi:MAG: transketolase C-terminal domain-containing protein [Caldilineaceae bacterium]